jgi:hypothetical protein
MNALLTSLVVFATMMAGAFAGWGLARILPERHLTPEGRDAIKVSIAMVATLSALVLGLLTASAKSALDAKEQEVRTMAAETIRFDRTLALYGPEASGVRTDFRALVASRIAAIWPDEMGDVAVDQVQRGPGIETIIQELLALTPKNDAERWLQSGALSTANDLTASRWTIVTQSSSAIQWPFITVVTLWLTIVFASFTLFAPRNWSVGAAMLIAAGAVAGAFYLIIEMDQPYSGVIRISSEPLRAALADLGNP